MKLKKQTQLVILLTILSTTTQATLVGVVVTFPDGNTYTECIPVPENTDGYEILQNTGLQIAWSYHDVWGYAICGINNVGCPEDNCWCSSEYWGFYLSTSGRWEYSPVGVSGYYAKQSDVLGFAYGPYGTTPKHVSFNDICIDKPGHGGSGLFNMTVNITNETHKNSPIELSIMDLKRNRTVKKATVIVYQNLAGTQRVYEGTTDGNGTLKFTINKTGEYEMEIRARDYWPIRRTINMLEATTTTTTSSTTTTTTTTRQTSFPYFLYKVRTLPTEETSQTTVETTTTMQETTTTLAEEIQITGKTVNVGKNEETSKTPIILSAAILAGLALLYTLKRNR